MEISIEPFLRCPLTHTPLTRVPAAELDTLNGQVSAGILHHLDGSPVQTPLEAALRAENGVLAYPLVDGIYILMPHLALVLDAEQAKTYRPMLVQEKIDMVAFYDESGWQKDGEDEFVDATRFEDLRPVSANYIAKCHARVGKYFPPTGDFLLDIASGPVQYKAYEMYSQGYKKRICADISMLALQEAKKNLGDHGVYLLCDITNIPLVDGTVDAFLSLHTVYHVPADQQRTAFAELQRVLKPGQAGVVVYSWGAQAPLMRFAGPWVKFIKQTRRKIAFWRKRGSRKYIPAEKAKPVTSSGVEKPYFNPHNYTWVQNNLRELGYTEFACWRSVSVSFMRNMIFGRLFGRQILNVLFGLESRFPRWFARYGQYPMLICKK